MKAVITDKQKIAQDTLLTTLKPSEKVNFKPGQYMDIILINPPFSDEKGPKRHFSICSSPNQKGVLKFCTRLRDSAFKRSLQEFPIGTEVEISHIGGNFVLPEDINQPYVFLAGGIGITPFMCMLAFIQEEGLQHQITLIYSNRDQYSTAFLKELQELEKKLPKFKLVLTMTDDSNWSGEKRMVDSPFLKEYFPNANSNIYMVVGPPPMVESIQASLKEIGVEAQNIKIENFTGY